MEGRRNSFFLPNKKNKQDKYTNQKVSKDNTQKKFDVSRNGLPKDGQEQNKVEEEKKQFDKKTYRLKKYSKKYKLEQWEEQRKKKLLYEYQKSIKNDAVPGTYKPKSFDEDVTDFNSEVGKFVRHPDFIEKQQEKPRKSKKDPYLKAKEQYNKVKQENIVKQETLKKSKEEKNQKLIEYKKNKQEKFKKLSKKTKKGQPVMSGRLELLLEKIQSSK